MSGHAVEENRASIGIGQEVGRLDELLERCARPAHGDDDPIHARLTYDPLLVDILRVIPIDGRERDDRPDLLPGDDPAKWSRPLPGTSDHPAGDDHGDPLLKKVVPKRRRAETKERRGDHRASDCNAPSWRHQPGLPFEIASALFRNPPK